MRNAIAQNIRTKSKPNQQKQKWTAEMKYNKHIHIIGIIIWPVLQTELTAFFLTNGENKGRGFDV